MSRPVCMVAGCARLAHRKGMCQPHYEQFKPKAPRAIRVCDVPGCGAKHYGKGLCRAHYDERFKPKAAPKWHLKAAVHLVCPDCGKPELEVKDSRATTENTIRRRRHCGACGARFTTFEVFAGTIQPRVDFGPAIKSLEGLLGVLTGLAEPVVEGDDIGT